MNTNWNDPNFQGFGGRQSPFGKRPPRPKKEHKAIGTPLSRTLINLAVTLIFAAVYFYVVLPPINLQAEEFYFFMLLCCAVYCGCAVLTSGFQGSGAKGYFGFVKKQCRIPMIIAVALVAVAIVGGIVGWQVIRAGSYRDLLTVETGDFATEVEEISYDQIPMLDKDSAEKLGNRKLGELSDMVSQFEVAEEYTQINYKGRPVRVTPLRYGDWIKWFNNRSEGLPAYLIIDMVTQNVEVVRLSATPPPSTSAATSIAICSSTTPPISLTSRPSRSTRAAIPIGSAPGSEKPSGSLAARTSTGPCW